MIALALEAFAAALKAIELSEAVLNTAKQNGEMTPEQEAAWDAHKKQRMAMSHWHPTPAAPPDRAPDQGGGQ